MNGWADTIGFTLLLLMAAVLLYLSICEVPA
jgi:hypothetical protein